MYLSNYETSADLINAASVDKSKFANLGKLNISQKMFQWI